MRAHPQNCGCTRPQNCRGCAHHRYVHNSGRGRCLALSCNCGGFRDELDEYIDQHHGLVEESDERHSFQHYREGRAL